MKKYLRYAGIFILLFGVCILILPAYLRLQSNATLLTGLGLVIAGIIVHIVIWRYGN